MHPTHIIGLSKASVETKRTKLKKMGENPNSPENDGFWWELQENVILDVPCSSWDPLYALKCFGEGFEGKTIEGKITKVKFTRGKKREVRFDVTFSEKKYEKSFTNFNLDYVWKYAREVPPKYQTMRAKYLVDLARAAGMLSEQLEDTGKSDTESGEDENLDLAFTETLPKKPKTKRAVKAVEKAPPPQKKGVLYRLRRI